jgi:glyoxylate reductase
MESQKRMKPYVFLTRFLPQQVTSELMKRFQLQYNRYNRPLSKAEIIRGVRKAEGLISMLSDSIDQEIMAAAPKLKVIANYAVGYNNIDIRAATHKNISVTNTPGVLTEATADLTWALILAAARRIPEAEQLLRSGQWTGWAPTQCVGSDIYGKTLGIIGMGRIGQAVARRAVGFSMKVVYYRRHRLPIKEEKRLKVHYLPVPSLLKASDFVSLHLPLTEKSYHLMDRRAFRLMKPTAFLINTARGPIVDEKALIEAITKKRIAGAGLDVFEEEPFVSTRLRKMKGSVLLPHIGSASRETRIRMGFMVCENLSAVFKGKKPPHQVN